MHLTANTHFRLPCVITFFLTSYFPLQAVTQDGYGCIRCPGSLSDEGKCQCPKGSILGESPVVRLSYDLRLDVLNMCCVYCMCEWLNKGCPFQWREKTVEPFWMRQSVKRVMEMPLHFLYQTAVETGMFQYYTPEALCIMLQFHSHIRDTKV